MEIGANACVGDDGDADPTASPLATTWRDCLVPGTTATFLCAGTTLMRPARSKLIRVGLNCVVVRSKSYRVLRYPGAGRTAGEFQTPGDDGEPNVMTARASANGPGE